MEIEKLEEGKPPADIDPEVYTTDADGYRISMSGDADSNYTGGCDCCGIHTTAEFPERAPAFNAAASGGLEPDC